MINRASVQLWGRVGQTAGPPKWAVKKNCCQGDCQDYCRSWATDPILSTQRIPRGGDLILSTQRMPRGGDMILATQTFSGPF